MLNTQEVQQGSESAWTLSEPERQARTHRLSGLRLFGVRVGGGRGAATRAQKGLRGMRRVSRGLPEAEDPSHAKCLATSTSLVRRGREDVEARLRAAEGEARGR